MKKFTFLLFAILSFNSLSAQLNMEYKSHVEYNENLNDIWGYAAPDDREYALVGLQQGVSIIDVTDSENPVIKGYAFGPSSTWRDMKTWGEYAYVTNETGAGLLVIDLSNLPNDLTTDDYFYWEPEIPSLSGTLSAAHNIFIDEFGFAILAGTNLNNGGLIFIDVTDPGNPQYVGAGAATYSHDVYARDNKAYSSEIYGGNFAIYDISDKSNVSLIATQNTAANFTHNTWLNDAGTVLFTTDEQGNAPIGAYDISDPGNIQELDQFRPLITLNQGVTPHNVHVWNDWIIVSYYTDGCVIIDGSRPDNLIEVGNFDTYLPNDPGFGAWGAYPYLPSETILVSDRGNGCYILEPTYVRACWLEGKVTDAGTGASIDVVNINIDSPQLNSGETDALGNYATGQAISGTFDVTFSHPSYQTLTTEAVLENGVVTILDVQLSMLASQEVSGLVVSEEDGSPIPFAPVYFASDDTYYETVADADGNFSVQSVIENDYTIYAGAWGFVNNSVDVTVSGGPANLTIELETGYADDFIVDLGWEINTNSITGGWERGEPNGTTYNDNEQSAPELDITGDVGNKCYVTGNDGTTAFDDDVDNGSTTLTSPIMDLTDLNDPVVKYSSWFFNDGGASDPNDSLIVKVSNGIDEVVLETITESNGAWNDAVEFLLSDFIDINANMTISFYSSDQVGNDEGHIVESAIDGFLVFDANPTAISAVFDENIIFDAFPSPFQNSFSVNYQLDNFNESAILKIFNVVGQQVEMIEIENKSGSLEINNLQNKGIYFLQIELDGRMSKALKIIKH